MGTTAIRRDLKPGTVFRYSWLRQPLYVDHLHQDTPPSALGNIPVGLSDVSEDSDLWDETVEVIWAPPEDATASPAKAPVLTTDKAARKAMPIARGVVDYFPRALAAIANVSFVANEQHNPGEPMHWDKSKSTDHADCIARHLIERGTVDDDGLRHSAKLAWRALALLETELSEQA